MKTSTLKAHALPALLAGTSRRPIEFAKISERLASAADRHDLRALSLTGQALRFERPRGPGEYTIEPVIEDQRRIIPESVRRPILRLLTIGRATDDLELAVAWALDRLHLRLHPFDLPKLDSFVRAHSEYLGGTAEHWVSRQDTSGESRASYFFADELDDTNWSAAAPRRRALYIADRRRQDAGGARDLVAAAWAHQAPDLRVKLLSAFETGLGPADQSFLDSAVKDRSPRVQMVARKLLSRLPNSDLANPALQTCMERIQRGKAGVLGRLCSLSLELPANIKESAEATWVRGIFSEVGWDEFARHMGMSEPEMIDASRTDPNLLLGLAWMATQDFRADLLASICEELPDAWERMSESGALDLSDLSFEKRSVWAEAVTRRSWGKPSMNYAAWTWLHHAVEGPLPAGLIQGTLRANWTDELEEKSSFRRAWPEMLAACCPQPVRSMLRAELANVDPSLTTNALSWMDILDTLETY